MTRPHGANRYLNGPDGNGQPGKGCRCGRCRKAATRNRNLHRLAALRGDSHPRVDATRVRAHVAALGEAGMTRLAIARAAGVTHSTLSRLMGTHRISPLKTVRAGTADAILAVHPGSGTDLLVCGIGAQRRLRALAWRGWPTQVIAQQADLAHQTVWRFMHTADLRITVDSAARVAAACRHLYVRNPLAAGVAQYRVAKAQERAAAAGWLPLGVWDDIDDPRCAPDLGEPVRRDEALLEDSEELVAQGFTVEQAADRLGVTAGYLRRVRSEARRKVAAS